MGTIIIAFVLRVTGFVEAGLRRSQNSFCMLILVPVTELLLSKWPLEKCGLETELNEF